MKHGKHDVIEALKKLPATRHHVESFIADVSIMSVRNEFYNFPPKVRNLVFAFAKAMLFCPEILATLCSLCNMI